VLESGTPDSDRNLDAGWRRALLELFPQTAESWWRQDRPALPCFVLSRTMRFSALPSAPTNATTNRDSGAYCDSWQSTSAGACVRPTDAALAWRSPTFPECTGRT